MQRGFEVGGMVPLVLWDDTLWDGTAIKLAPAGPPAAPGSARKASPGEEPFAGRYTAVMLTSKVSPGKGRRILRWSLSNCCL